MLKMIKVDIRVREIFYFVIMDSGERVEFCFDVCSDWDFKGKVRE